MKDIDLTKSKKDLPQVFDHARNKLISLSRLSKEINGNLYCRNSKLTIGDIIIELWDKKVQGEIITNFEFNFNKFFRLTNRDKIKMIFEKTK